MSVIVLYQLLCVYVIEDQDSSKVIEQLSEMSISRSQTMKVRPVLYLTVVWWLFSIVDNQSRISFVVHFYDRYCTL